REGIKGPFTPSVSFHSASALHGPPGARLPGTPGGRYAGTGLFARAVAGLAGLAGLALAGLGLVALAGLRAVALPRLARVRRTAGQRKAAGGNTLLEPLELQIQMLHSLSPPSCSRFQSDPSTSDSR